MRNLRRNPLSPWLRARSHQRTSVPIEVSEGGHPTPKIGSRLRVGIIERAQQGAVCPIENEELPLMATALHILPRRPHRHFGPAIAVEISHRGDRAAELGKCLWSGMVQRVQQGAIRSAEEESLPLKPLPLHISAGRSDEQVRHPIAVDVACRPQ